MASDPPPNRPKQRSPASSEQSVFSGKSNPTDISPDSVGHKSPDSVTEASHGFEQESRLSLYDPKNEDQFLDDFDKLREMTGLKISIIPACKPELPAVSTPSGLAKSASGHLTATTESKTSRTGRSRKSRSPRNPPFIHNRSLTVNASSSSRPMIQLEPCVLTQRGPNNNDKRERFEITLP